MRSPRSVVTTAGVLAATMMLLIAQTHASGASATTPPESKAVAPIPSDVSAAAPAAPATGVWFPELRGRDLSLDRPPVRLADSSGTPIIVIKEQPLIPLPPAAWSGLTGLVVAGIFGSFRSLRRFVLR